MPDNPLNPASIPPALPHSAGASLFFRAAVVIVVLLGLLALGRQFGTALSQFAAWVAEWGALGPLPGTILYVYYGRLAGEVAVLARDGAATKGPGDYVLLGVGLVATVLVTAFVTRTVKHALKTTQDGVASRDAQEQNQ